MWTCQLLCWAGHQTLNGCLMQMSVSVTREVTCGFFLFSLQSFFTVVFHLPSSKGLFKKERAPYAWISYRGQDALAPMEDDDDVYTKTGWISVVFLEKYIGSHRWVVTRLPTINYSVFGTRRAHGKRGNCWKVPDKTLLPHSVFQDWFVSVWELERWDWYFDLLNKEMWVLQNIEFTTDPHPNYEIGYSVDIF